MSETAPANCPRCHYDLSGHVQSWTSSCPVEGQCSECGLEFAWREILVETERTNPLHIEHCARRAIPVAGCRSAVWCVLPFVFWKRVKLQHEPRLKRMILWLVLILFGAHLAASTATAFALWRLDVLQWQELASQSGVQTPIRDMLIEARESFTEARDSEDPAAASGLGMDSQMLGEFIDKLDAMIERTPKSWLQPGFGPRYFAPALGYPFLLVRDHDDLMTATRDLTDWGWNRATQRGISFRIIRFWSQPALLAGVAATLGFPAMLWLLPATRRKLRIHSLHIARATIFGCTWLLLPAGLRLVESVGVAIQAEAGSGFLANGFTSFNTAPFTASWQIDWAMWAWVTFAWISLWWLLALRAFRFPWPTIHWLVLTTVVMLLATALYMYEIPYEELEYLFRLDDWWNITPDWLESTPQRIQSGEVDLVQW